MANWNGLPGVLGPHEPRFIPADPAFCRSDDPAPRAVGGPETAASIERSISGPDSGLTRKSAGTARRNTTISRAPGRRMPPSTRYRHGRGRFVSKRGHREPRGSGTKREYFRQPAARSGSKAALSGPRRTSTTYPRATSHMGRGLRGQGPIPASPSPALPQPALGEPRPEGG